jgi:hypothetical protein
MGIIASTCLSGCATSVDLPEVDLAADGWRIWTGQAVWTRNGESPPIAGEVIVARDDQGDVYASFSKPPLPIFSARTHDGTWRIDVVEGGKSYSGRGDPPKRFVWFDLPVVLEGGAPRGMWSSESPGPGEYLIRNTKTGESVRLVLDL